MTTFPILIVPSMIIVASVVIILIFTGVIYIGEKFTSKEREAKFYRWYHKHNVKAINAAASLLFVAVVVLIVSFITIRMDYALLQMRYESVKMTWTESKRGGARDVKKENILRRISRINRSIILANGWNNSIWTGWLIPDKVANLDLIE